MFSINNQNLKHVEQAVNHFGEIWFHGDGNIYHKKEDSDFRKDFSNDPVGHHTYRLHIKKGDKIPATVEEMNKALLSAKSKEVAESSISKEVSGIATFSASGAAEGDEVKKTTKKGKEDSASGAAEGGK